MKQRIDLILRQRDHIVGTVNWRLDFAQWSVFVIILLDAPIEECRQCGIVSDDGSGFVGGSFFGAAPMSSGLGFRNVRMVAAVIVSERW